EGDHGRVTEVVIRQRSPGRAELLNAVVAVVHDEDVAGGVGRHSPGISELPVTAAVRAPLRLIGTRARELLNAIASKVRNVDVTGVRRHCGRAIELPGAAAKRAPLADVGTGVRELLDAVVSTVGDVDAAGGVGRHSVGIVELPTAAA